MRKVKNYIESDLAKRKITRYKYWSIKDENGITIVSSDDNPEGKSFSELLDKIISDNVDVEVQVKYGTNEQSSRQNPPMFVRINQDIEWIDPVEEEPEEVRINGVAHKVDKNGNVNINLATPMPSESEPKVETANIDYFRQEMEMQLSGIRREHKLKEDKMKVDLQNKLFEQTLTFKEMMLKDREAKVLEKEQALAAQEALYEERKKEIQSDLKGYLKQVPSVLGGLVKEFILKKDDLPVGDAKQEEPKTEEPKPRRKVNFTIESEPEAQETEIINEENLEEDEQQGIQHQSPSGS
jgi:hypothetical protein